MHTILIKVKAMGRHGVTEEKVLGVGQEMSPQTGSMELTCGEKTSPGGRDSLVCLGNPAKL